MESTLQQQISSFQERNAKTVEAIKALDCEIEKKRAHLSRLESAAKLTKKRAGYDAAEIGAFLKLRVINDDFASSKEEIARLHEKLNELHCSYLSLSEGACDQ
jgi:predicted  nucleic acid-binding Zn-ribbon protein